MPPGMLRTFGFRQATVWNGWSEIGADNTVSG